MKPEQARSDERDNHRVFRFGTIIAIVLALLAITYNLMLHKRAEGPVNEPPTQSAPQNPSGNPPLAK
jgi:hypothetical protein